MNSLLEELTNLLRQGEKEKNTTAYEMEEKTIRSSREQRGLCMINLHSWLDKKHVELKECFGQGNRFACRETSSWR